MPETLLPIVVTASSSSFWRRPVMKTYAPSLTKSCAVANPMPSVPPVITATFPSNLPTAFLLLMPALLHQRSAPFLPGRSSASQTFPVLNKSLLKLCRTIGAHQPDVPSNQLLMLIEGGTRRRAF